MSLAESHGPDRCRGNLNCRHFHDEDGLPENYGNLYQCCCCDTCTTIRPVTVSDKADVPVHYCCRCVPRVIFVRFVPDDTEDACCVTSAVPAFYTKEESGHRAIYTATIFGVTVVAKLGKLYGGGACAWQVTATKAGYELADETYLLADGETCLNVPAFSLEVEGPNGCDGTIQLGDFSRAKVPFIQQQKWDDDYEGKFIELYGEECGDCGQVCSTLCVDGVRHDGDTEEKVEFRWFDTGDERGWGAAGTPEYGEHQDRILLVENEYGECTLVTDFEEGAEHFDPVTIDTARGCSCGLQETFIAFVGQTALGFTVRCGYCSCWEFICGTLRCVPAELCVLLIVGTSASRLILSWDATNKRWGSDSDPLRLVIGSDGAGGCQVTAEMTYIELDAEPVPWQSSRESITKVFDSSADFQTITLHDPDNRVTIIASDQSPDCVLGACDEATPCLEECGSHPAQLTVNIKLWRQLGDLSDPYVPEDECDIDVTVYFWEVAVVGSEGVEFHCGYTGWADLPGASNPNCNTDFIRLDLHHGTLYLSTYYGVDDQSPGTGSFVLDLEECDPYYGYYLHTFQFNQTINPGFDPTCIGCEVSMTRMEITITE